MGLEDVFPESLSGNSWREKMATAVWLCCGGLCTVPAPSTGTWQGALQPAFQVQVYWNYINSEKCILELLLLVSSLFLCIKARVIVMTECFSSG